MNAKSLPNPSCSKIFHGKLRQQKISMFTNLARKNQTLTLAILQQLLEFFKQIFKITDFTFHLKIFFSYLFIAKVVTYLFSR